MYGGQTKPINTYDEHIRLEAFKAENYTESTLLHSRCMAISSRHVS